MEEKRIGKIESLFSVGTIIKGIGIIALAFLGAWANITWVNSQEAAKLSAFNDVAIANITEIKSDIEQIENDISYLKNNFEKFNTSQNKFSEDINGKLDILLKTISREN